MSDHRPRIGLALGSGAARGLAHIGVLKVLDEAAIPIDVIAGTSIGALIGALYAAGVSPRRMEEITCNLNWRDMARLLDPVLPTSGLLDSNRVARFMARLLPVDTFEKLRIPLAVTATDVETGEALIIRKGNLREGLRATIAFPGIFAPVPFGTRFLVDGGLCNPVPAEIAYNMGATRVIGVCAIPPVRKPGSETSLPPQSETSHPRTGWRNFFTAAGIEKLLRETWSPSGRTAQPTSGPRQRKPPNIFSICARSVAIMENQINALRLERARIDALIQPDFGELNMLEFHRAAETIAAGEVAARAMLPRLKRLNGA
jgi:NTE family protein